MHGEVITTKRMLTYPATWLEGGETTDLLGPPVTAFSVLPPCPMTKPKLELAS